MVKQYQWVKSGKMFLRDKNAYQWSDTVDFMFTLYLHCISDINGSKWFGSIHVCLVVSQNVVFQNKPSAFPISPEKKKCL